MLVILEKVLAIFLIMAVGFIFYKIKLMNTDIQAALSKFLLYVAVPGMIFDSITSNTLENGSVGIVLKTMLLGGIYLAVMCFIAYFVSKYVFKVPSNDIGAYILLIASANSGFMGFPVTLALFGEGVVFYMAIFNVMLTILTNSVSPVILQIGSTEGEKPTFKQSIKSFFNINMIASIIALAMYFSGLHFPTPLANTFNMFSNTTAPLALFIIGMQLAQSDFKVLLKNTKLLTMAVLKMVLPPIGMFLVVDRFDLPVNVKLCLVLAATLPTAAIITVMANNYKKNGTLCAEFTAVTTLISIITLVLVATFLNGYYHLV